MRLYHGSTVEVREPLILDSRRKMDFGRGFYTTSSRDQAISWAVRVSRIRKERPVINIYEFDETSIGSLETIRFDSPSVDWLEFVISNRKGECDAEYDLAIGPVANDTVYETLAAFESGAYTMEETISRLKPETLYDQYLFHTERSLGHLVFVGSEEIRWTRPDSTSCCRR